MMNMPDVITLRISATASFQSLPSGRKTNACEVGDGGNGGVAEEFCSIVIVCVNLPHSLSI